MDSFFAESPSGWMGRVGACFLQRCSIRYNSGLKFGYSRTVTEWFWHQSSGILPLCLDCVLIGRWTFPQRSRPLWDRLLSRIPLYFTTFIFTKSPNFCCRKTSPQDDAAIIMLHCRNGIGQVMSSARHDAWHSGQFNFCFIRPETFVFLWFESRVSELDRTSALIAAKGAPIKYWAKAVNTYVHVIFLLLFYLFSIQFQEFQAHFFTFYYELFCVDFQDEKLICSGIRL